MSDTSLKTYGADVFYGKAVRKYMAKAVADKLEDTTTEYNLFVWFFKVYLKSFFDNFIALAKANFDGLVILFKGTSKAE